MTSSPAVHRPCRYLSLFYKAIYPTDHSKWDSRWTSMNWSALIVFAAFIASVSTAPAALGPVVTLSYGSFKGNAVGNVAEFLGMPFAAPPWVMHFSVRPSEFTLLHCYIELEICVSHPHNHLYHSLASGQLFFLGLHVFNRPSFLSLAFHLCLRYLLLPLKIVRLVFSRDQLLQGLMS